jgi:hypothetical protein
LSSLAIPIDLFRLNCLIELFRSVGGPLGTSASLFQSFPPPFTNFTPPCTTFSPTASAAHDSVASPIERPLPPMAVSPIALGPPHS